MTIFHWLGQACFLITTLLGTRILVDPPDPSVGYNVPAHSVPAHAVFVSHAHPDHSYTAAAAPVNGNAPRVINPLPLSPDGLTQTGSFSYGSPGEKGDMVKFTRIAAFHDNAGGTKRGQDTLTVIETGGLRVVHLGDIGQLTLTPDQVKAIGRVDVLLIPVGGFFTVDGPQAAALAEQLKARVVIPMHYQTPALNADLKTKLAPPGAFLAAMKGHAAIVHVAARDLKLSPATLPKMPTVYVLRYK